MCPAAHPKKQLKRPLPLTHGTRGVNRTPPTPQTGSSSCFYSNTLLKRARTRVTSAHTVRAPAPSTTPQVRLARRNDTFPSRSSRSCFGARRPRSRASRASVKRSNFFSARRRGVPPIAFSGRARALLGRGVLSESCARAWLAAGRARRPGGGVRRRTRGSRSFFAPASRCRPNAVVRGARARVSVARIVLSRRRALSGRRLRARYAFRRASRIVPFRRASRIVRALVLAVADPLVLRSLHIRSQSSWVG